MGFLGAATWIKMRTLVWTGLQYGKRQAREVFTTSHPGLPALNPPQVLLSRLHCQGLQGPLACRQWSPRLLKGQDQGQPAIRNGEEGHRLQVCPMLLLLWRNLQLNKNSFQLAVYTGWRSKQWHIYSSIFQQRKYQQHAPGNWSWI